MMDKALCACKDELTIHKYVVQKDTGEDGALCISCRTFKPLNDDGEFDVMEHYERMKNNAPTTK